MKFLGRILPWDMRDRDARVSLTLTLGCPDRNFVDGAAGRPGIRVRTWASSGKALEAI